MWPFLLVFKGRVSRAEILDISTAQRGLVIDHAVLFSGSCGLRGKDGFRGRENV